MSIFLPYNSSVVINYITTVFNIDLTTLSSYEISMLTIISNIYFFIYWGFIIYISLKIFNRIWERFF